MNSNRYIHAAIDKFNEYINSQKLLPGKVKITIIEFDDKYEVLCDYIDLEKTPIMTIDNWTPRGMTALYDAIGKGINTLTDTYNKLKPEEIPSKVLVVILTDGLENSSTEFDGKMIKKLIEEKQEKNWNFIFLGANQDAFAVSNNLGISRGNTMTFSADAAGAAVYTMSLNNATSSYRGMSANSSDFNKMSKTLLNNDDSNNVFSCHVYDVNNAIDIWNVLSNAGGTFNKTDGSYHTHDQKMIDYIKSNLNLNENENEYESFKKKHKIVEDRCGDMPINNVSASMGGINYNYHTTCNLEC
jgi:uncharacterized protein YegL